MSAFETHTCRLRGSNAFTGSCSDNVLFVEVPDSAALDPLRDRIEQTIEDMKFTYGIDSQKEIDSLLAAAVLVLGARLMILMRRAIKKQEIQFRGLLGLRRGNPRAAMIICCRIGRCSQRPV